MSSIAPVASVVIALADEAATERVAAAVAAVLSPPARVFLSGELGVGKTTLVRGLLRGLGHTGRVRSPTFTLLEPYNLPSLSVYHFDFYRFSTQDAWREAGFDEYFGGPGVCLVEWPELAGPGLPRPDLWIHLRFGAAPSDEGARVARLDAYSEAGLRCLNAAAAAC